MLVHLCCDLYRSPSWPVWAPRIPNSYQNNQSAQPTDTFAEPLSSHLFPLSHMASRTRFWSASSPLSSHGRQTDALDSMTTGVTKSIHSVRKQQQPLYAGNGFLNNGSRHSDCRNDANENSTILVTAGSIFKVPDVPRHSHKNYERNSFEARNERNAMMNAVAKENNEQGNVFAAPIVKPRINHACWRGMSKTCDCIEKGKTSPVLRLVDQARAVSSPDPLHRPDNQRASLRSATTAQVLR